ncbi:hypothetical protein GCM10023149_24740 [Mucilaginibacter gynuensis]|uniref:Uncharacterized protein n=1 Tax=Mucilaginibacter gynuensis TaxID=1302236 RepID=A0ABP8GFW6_9SPHI
MKIRIKGNSVRYRLTRSEVERFTATGYFEEATSFGDQQLIYALQQYNEAELSAKFENNKITLLMPQLLAKEWATTDRVGFNNNSSTLYLLIEKDFVCIDAMSEDQSDNYPNPLLK